MRPGDGWEGSLLAENSQRRTRRYSVRVKAGTSDVHSRVDSALHRYVAYHHEGMAPGTHLGLPSPSITVVLSVGPPTHMVAMPDPRQRPESFMALVGGLHTRPVVIGYGEIMAGVQLDLAPQAARRLLGVPASALACSVLHMHDILGPAATELVDRLQTTSSWDARRDAVFDVLGRQNRAIDPAPTSVDRAWELIVSSHGTMPIADVADDVGWSRRHLDREFVAEFGLTPKDVARITRFTYSRTLLAQHPRMSMAMLSAMCGYYDQAHMAREWNRFAGEPASAWWADEGVRFFQAPGGQNGASSAA
jgi:AraC-like DNA-binding protein